MSEPVEGIAATPSEENMRYFYIHMDGPVSTPFEGGTFKLELFLPEEYPMAPPKVCFLFCSPFSHSFFCAAPKRDCAHTRENTRSAS